MFSSWLEYVWGSAESQDRDKDEPKMADDWVLVGKTAMDIDCDQEVNAAVESAPIAITKTAASDPETLEIPKSAVQLQSKSESKRKKSTISITDELEPHKPKNKNNSKQNVKQKLKNREITAENLPQRIMTRSQKFHYNRVANVSNDRKCGRQQTW